jgi:hypothetical protein
VEGFMTILYVCEEPVLTNYKKLFNNPNPLLEMKEQLKKWLRCKKM